MIGDFTPGKTVVCRFNTHKADGTPITLAGTPAVSVYKNSTTESTAGVTLTVDYDSRTGLHSVAVDTSADGTFYAAGNDFDLVITAGTVDSISVVGTKVGTFSLSNRSALRPTTADRTLDVAATGEAGLDFTNRLDTTGILPNVAAGAAGGLFIAGSNAATTISGLTTVALSCTTITASGAVAFQSTFAVTTSSSFGAISGSTLTLSGAVAFQSTFAVTGTTTLTGAVTASNASNDIVGIDVAKAAGTAWNSGAIKAATFTAGAIDAAAIAADFSTEVNAAVLAVLGTPIASLAQDIVDTTQAISNSLSTLATQVGTAGDGLSAIPWNAAWDAEVESECADAITAAALATAANLATVAGYLDTEIAAIQTAVVTSIPATLSTIAGYIDTEVAAIKAKTDLIPAAPASTTNITAASGVTLTSGERDSIAAALLDLASGVETSVTVRQSLRAMAAALAGKVTGSGSAYAALGNTGTPRLAVVDDGSGDRSVTPTL